VRRFCSRGISLALRLDHGGGERTWTHNNGLDGGTELPLQRRCAGCGPQFWAVPEAGQWRLGSPAVRWGTQVTSSFMIMERSPPSAGRRRGRGRPTNGRVVKREAWHATSPEKDNLATSYCYTRARGCDVILETASGREAPRVLCRLPLAEAVATWLSRFAAAAGPAVSMTTSSSTWALSVCMVGGWWRRA
jgi:hypothetical protein